MSDITSIYRYDNIEQFRDALNSAPVDGTVLSRELGGGRTSRYLPIHVQEAVADVLFREWNVIDEKFQVVHNEILCTVKIQYLPDYPGADYQFCTGSGSKAIQQNKGSLPEDFPKGKKTNAIEYNSIAAKANAISDALQGLGNLFGRNLNRACSDNFAIKKNRANDN